MNGSQLFDEINKEVSKVIFGKEEELKLILSCWLSGGHILLEDVPGNGKTVLSKTLAKIFKVDFSRVQFTPDLLPSDILGTTIYDEEARKFYFRKGPLFTTLFLADEINRATPRTQSALLEAMAERQITIEKMSSELDELFFVMATQNPVEQYGTFPLPEAQLDRFFMQISLGYPKRDDELLILKSREKTNPMTEVKSIIEPSQFKNLKEEVKNVDIPDTVYNYALDIVGATREHKKLKMGASPRGPLALCHCARAYAFLEGRDTVLPKDIYNLSIPVLGHRIMIDPQAHYSGETTEHILRDILTKVKSPIK